MATRQETNRPQEQQPKQSDSQSKPSRQSEMQTKPSESSRQSERSMVPHRRGESMARYGGWEPFTWEPFTRLFDQFSRSWLGLSGGWEGRWGLDIREEDDNVIVRAEAPGFEPSDFDIQVRGDQLLGLGRAHWLDWLHSRW